MRVYVVAQSVAVAVAGGIVVVTGDRCVAGNARALARVIVRSLRMLDPVLRWLATCLTGPNPVRAPPHIFAAACWVKEKWRGRIPLGEGSQKWRVARRVCSHLKVKCQKGIRNFRIVK